MRQFNKYVKFNLEIAIDALATEMGKMDLAAKFKQVRKDQKALIKKGKAYHINDTSTGIKQNLGNLLIDDFNNRFELLIKNKLEHNIGKIEAEIRSDFDFINIAGEPYQVSISREYCELRIQEAKIGSAILIKKREMQEEQRELREQMREEEKSRKERENALKEQQKRERLVQEAYKKAFDEAKQAQGAERAAYEEKLEQLELQIKEIEEKKRALSMAQQTRIGVVYIISNVGAFGEDVYKIGMTRRLDPRDRIDELSGASVPFGFDIHAFIETVDAPKLEKELHQYFNEYRINKINARKEFFKVPIEKIRAYLEVREIPASFTMMAEARQYHETQAINALPLEQRKLQERRLEQSQLYLQANPEGDVNENG